MVRKALGSFILLTITICAVAQSKQDVKTADSLVSAFVAKTQIPGLSVSISQKGKFVFSKGYGHTDIARTQKVKPGKSKFRIGSVSKTLTASGLALLYEQGKVNLDLPIESYVNSWPEKKHTVTLRLLAGHLAGIRHYRGAEFLSSKKYETVTSGLDIFINDPLINVPGTQYSYSSYAWNLISAAMEKAHGSKDFLSLMQEDVFDALKMKNTEADHADRTIKNRSDFFVMQNDRPAKAPYVDNSYKWAGGGFVGTTEDLCRFGQAHMKAGFLKQTTLDEWMRSQKTRDGKETNYGIGWRIFKRPSGNTFVGHSGGSVGGITFFLMHLPTETVLAITGNMSPLNYAGLQFQLMEMFIDGE